MDFPYLETLNEEQRNAVIHTGSPLLILAGAGSGKTRVITTKIAYMIQNGVNPHGILAVTFTKKAANEMRERAIALEEKASLSVIKTFHSFGAWLLRRYTQEAGIDKNFTVYDDDDTISLILKAVPSLKRKDAALAAKKISLAKDYCLEPEDDLSFLQYDGNLNEIYSKYQKRLRTTGNVDFGDLIILTYKTMRDNADIRRQIHFRFRVILVDEYQDSNIAQFKLLQMLSGLEDGENKYVCVVGDDDQSIYKFRGAEVQNILQFSNVFPDTELIRLTKNYRSGAKILAAADAVVSHNSNRLGKTLEAVKEGGRSPILAFPANEEEEAALCVSLIDNAYKNGIPYNDWAVLYRTNAQSLSLEKELSSCKIPYVLIGSLKFYEREEIKDVRAWLSLIANFKDEAAFGRIINKPSRGIGPKAQDLIIETAQNFDNEDNGNLVLACQQIESLSKKAALAANEFSEIVISLRKKLDKPPEELKLNFFLENLIAASGIAEYYKARDEFEDSSRMLNLNELLNQAAKYDYSELGLLDFLDSIGLEKTSFEESKDIVHDRVNLITLHNTKGLEFSHVIIVGLEEGIFPREGKTDIELEEERRLFYVGITRAKDALFVTSCRFRKLYGFARPMYPSRFLHEAGDTFKTSGIVPESYINGNFYEAGNDKFSDLKSKWKKGTVLYHDDYGYGQVIAFRVDDNFIIKVRFETGFIKEFMPGFQSHSLMIIKD